MHIQRKKVTMKNRETYRILCCKKIQ